MAGGVAQRSRLRAAWSAGGFFFVVYTVLAIVKYRSFHSGIDLGIFTQALSSGSWSLRDTVERGSHFGFHFSPVLYLCVPVLALAKSAVALQVVQAFAGGLVPPAVYLIAARQAPVRTALVLAWGAIAYPPLAAVTFVDFHENGFVAPVVLWLAWSVLARRFGLAAALAALMLAIKEDEALILAFAAVVTSLSALHAGDKRLATLAGGTALVAMSVFVAYFAWLQPLAAGGGAWDPLRFYAASGRGAEHAVPYPSFQRLGYVLEALYPLLFAPLFSKRFVFVLPGLAEDVLSRQSLPFSMNSHYPAVWVPWMLFAAIDGCATLRGLAPRRLHLTATAMLVVSAAVLIFSSPTHWRRYLSWPSAHDAALQARLDALPPGVSIRTQDEIFSHLGFQPNANVGFPNAGEALPAIVVIDETRASDSFFVPLLDARMKQANSGYVLTTPNDAGAVYFHGSIHH